MNFFRTSIKGSGRGILLNLCHVQNVYDDHGCAVFVMLPAGKKRQRIFETSSPFDEAAMRLNLVTKEGNS